MSRSENTGTGGQTPSGGTIVGGTIVFAAVAIHLVIGEARAARQINGVFPGVSGFLPK